MVRPFLSQTLPSSTAENKTFDIPFPSQVFQAEFSPYEWSQNLLCVALQDRIVVGTITFQEETEDTQESIEFNVLLQFSHGSRIHAIAWSPETSLSVLPKLVTFCAVDSEFNVCLFSNTISSDVNICSAQKTVGTHSDYINAVAYDPEGNYLASTGDDHTCKLWPLKDGSEVTFYLTSPGMSVSWHRQEPSKLLVAEKSGLLLMYNVETQRAILSLDAGQFPLMAADWSPSNCSRVGCIAGGELIVWDVTAPSLPVEARPVHMEGGRFLRFAPSSENHVATIGRTDHQLKVSHVGTNQPILSAPLKVAGGLSWHFRLPLVCAGSDRKLLFWKVMTK